MWLDPGLLCAGYTISVMTQAAEGGWSLVCPLQAYLEPEPVGEARLPAEEGREAAEHVVKMVNQGPNTKGTLFFFF